MRRSPGAADIPVGVAVTRPVPGGGEACSVLGAGGRCWGQALLSDLRPGQGQPARQGDFGAHTWVYVPI